MTMAELDACRNCQWPLHSLASDTVCPDIHSDWLGDLCLAAHCFGSGCMLAFSGSAWLWPLSRAGELGTLSQPAFVSTHI